jgi:putative DNA primase/helicase
MELTPNTLTVLEKRYFKKDEHGILTDWHALLERVKPSISLDDDFTSTADNKVFYDYLSDKYFDETNLIKTAECWAKTDSNYVYCLEDDKWYEWNGKYWEIRNDIPKKGIIRFVDRLEKYAASLKEIKNIKANERNKIIKNTASICKKLSASTRRQEDVLNEAKNLPDEKTNRKILVPKMNPDIRYLTFNNGVLDTVKWEFHPFNKDYLLTNFLDYKIPQTIEEIKDCPRFIKFIQEIFPDQPDIQLFTLDYLGYLLYPKNKEEFMLFLYGTGNNGKSVFCNTLCKILGSYSCTLENYILSTRDDLAVKKSQQKALMKHSFIAVVKESDKQISLSESTIKELASKDPIKGEEKYKNSFDFPSSCKVMVPVNHKPNFTSVVRGLQRRVLYVPFLREFKSDEEDKNLEDILENEYEGIMHLLLLSLFYYIQNGLNIPESMREYKTELLKESNDFESFIQDKCLICDKNYREKLHDVLTAYSLYLSEDETPPSGFNKKFRDSVIELLKQKGCTVTKNDTSNHNNTSVYGIQLVKESSESFTDPLFIQNQQTSIAYC